jgi:hypothetical protein
MSAPEYAINTMTAVNAAMTAPFLVLLDGLKRSSHTFSRREARLRNSQDRFSLEGRFKSLRISNSSDFVHRQ